MAVFKIPVTPQRNQRFDVTINGIRYNFRLVWNGALNAWVLDIYDEAETPILTGVPLVTGSDLLDQFEYLGIGVNENTGTMVSLRALTYAVHRPPEAVPTFENFGTDAHLYYITRPIYE
jgi:hypothetical protein